MKTVLVLGTARAGTSMTCGLVKRLGVEILHTPPTPSMLAHNPKGNYEFAPLFHLATEIAKEAKGQPHEDVDKLVHEILIPNIPTDGDWGFKIIGHQILRPIMPHISQPHLICVFRDFYEQAKSFQKMRLEIDNILTPLPPIIAEIAAAYKEITQIALDLCPQMPVSQISYFTLRKDPVAEAERVAEFLGIEITNQMRADVLNYIDTF